MTYTANLRGLASAIGSLREGLTATDDEVLVLRQREKQLAAMEAEDDADLAAEYGLEPTTQGLTWELWTWARR